MDMMNISVSARALVAARAVDPHVSTAAVRAAVEAALAEQRRELEIRRSAVSDDPDALSPSPESSRTTAGPVIPVPPQDS
jgi:hypothetical protein